MGRVGGACSQLEVLRNTHDGSEKGSLLWLMNHTLTPFGSRLLRNWVAHPLRDRSLIGARLSAVEEIAFGGAGPFPTPRSSNSWECTSGGVTRSGLSFRHRELPVGASA